MGYSVSYGVTNLVAGLATVGSAVQGSCLTSHLKRKPFFATEFNLNSLSENRCNLFYPFRLPTAILLVLSFDVQGTRRQGTRSALRHWEGPVC